MRKTAQIFDPRQTMRQQEFEIFHYHDTRPADVEVHHHDFYEIYFFLSGAVDYWVEGRTYRLRPGDLMLIHPMQLHRPIITADTAYERIVLWIDKHYLENLSPDGSILLSAFEGGSVNIFRPSPLQRTELSGRLSALVRESYSKEPGANLCAKGIFLQCLVEISRLSQRTAKGKEEMPELTAKVLSFISEHYNRELSLEQISDHFFVSKYHLSHQFSKDTGISIYRFILLKRLQAARQMLIDGKSPGEVYIECGFKDYSNFYRAFKAEYGISPRKIN